MVPEFKTMWKTYVEKPEIGGGKKVVASGSGGAKKKK